MLLNRARADLTEQEVGKKLRKDGREEINKTLRHYERNYRPARVSNEAWIVGGNNPDEGDLLLASRGRLDFRAKGRNARERTRSAMGRKDELK